MRRALLGLAAVVAISCGKAGPPLPPLHLVPGPVTDVKARRSADEMRFTFVLPTRNTNGEGAVDLARIEVFGATVAAGALAPPNRELTVPRHLVATLEVRPPAQKKGDTTLPDDPKDTRPKPGDTVSITEKLDATKLEPVFTTMPPPMLAPPVTAAPTAPVTAPVAEPAPKVAKRLYVIRGVARSGRPGQPAARIELPLTDLPAAPTALAAKFTETALTLSWTPPAPDETKKDVAVFNIYPADSLTPLNTAPLAESTFQREGVEFGKEECFVVRTVRTVGTVQIESGPSDRVCVTPADVFAPAAPKGLAAVGSTGFISLIWDANTEADLAGYLVLRGEVPGDKLQPLTPAPIKETTFRDTTVKPGVRYVYAIVAVDTAKPPNTSAQSTRVEDTAR